MSPTYRPAAIKSVEAYPTVSGSTGGGRDENGNPYFFPNVSVSIGYWFDNEGVPSSNWDTFFTAELWINGKLAEKKQDLAGGGQQTYTFFAHKFPAPGTYAVEVRGKNTQPLTVTIKNPPVEEKRAVQ
ncbi:MULTISPECIES: hypothetical protein [unclassified Methanoculleus]|jgi:hypothetical protein|uniref:PKD domain-containing protein n=1 Tax=Methanoculleus palmolei TaxID=72612 RepID=A0ABD8AAP7_9EURY|nr:hypothetical protein [Methanoculleus sp. UBA377]MDD2473719.1 hypothetical protein [Methanoculleus sp.]WOX55661.1 hypothetical protein R6Y95_09330 [Methanoculleus palmolei]